MDRLIWTIYGVILLYFIIGGVGFYRINKNKSKERSRESYLKFFTYFLIINLLFLSIVYQPLFRMLSMAIVILGLYELVSVFYKSKYGSPLFFTFSVVIYSLFSVGFIRFGYQPLGVLLYVFLITSIFDSFSQISGQLFGKRKILPRISPNKTLEGSIGGAFIAILSGYLLKGLFPSSDFQRWVMILGVVIFAFIGDTLASLYKRKYRVKDFSRLVPGHGGILDRFDSLIAAGFWVVVYYELI